MTKITPDKITVGDMIMPPKRELSLWMRRDCKAKGLNEEALLLKVLAIDFNYKIDKGGSWVGIKALYSEAFTRDQMRPYPEGREFNFMVRQNTLISKGA